MQLPSVDRATDWRAQRADLYPTVASGADPVRPIQNVRPIESMDRSGEGAIVKTPDKPSDADMTPRDWTLLPEKKGIPPATEPPQEPIYKQLIELLQSMWRASGSAIEMAQDVNKTTLNERMAQQANNEQVTYADPSVKRIGKG